MVPQGTDAFGHTSTRPSNSFGPLSLISRACQLPPFEQSSSIAEAQYVEGTTVKLQRSANEVLVLSALSSQPLPLIRTGRPVSGARNAPTRVTPGKPTDRHATERAVRENAAGKQTTPQVLSADGSTCSTPRVAVLVSDDNPTMRSPAAAARPRHEPHGRVGVTAGR